MQYSSPSYTFRIASVSMCSPPRAVPFTISGHRLAPNDSVMSTVAVCCTLQGPRPYIHFGNIGLRPYLQQPSHSKVAEQNANSIRRSGEAYVQLTRNRGRQVHVPLPHVWLGMRSDSARSGYSTDQAIACDRNINARLRFLAQTRKPEASWSRSRCSLERSRFGMQ